MDWVLKYPSIIIFSIWVYICVNKLVAFIEFPVIDWWDMKYCSEFCCPLPFYAYLLKPLIPTFSQNEEISHSRVPPASIRGTVREVLKTSLLFEHGCVSNALQALDPLRDSECTLKICSNSFPYIWIELPITTFLLLSNSKKKKTDILASRFRYVSLRLLSVYRSPAIKEHGQNVLL